MRYAVAALAVVVVAALAGCASNPCAGSHPYEHAKNGAALKGVGGLTAPAPDPSYQIPQVAASGPRFISRQRNARGKEVRFCLATPPAMPPGAHNAAAKTASLHD